MTITTSPPTGWWDSLKHSGLLIAPSRLRDGFAPPPEQLPRFVLDRLRREIVRLGEKRSGAEMAELLDVVLEYVCGLTGSWLKGSQVGTEWTWRTPAGDAVRPRRIWRTQHNGCLPVFVDNEQRLGVGRSRRSVARVIEWLRAKELRLALITNGRQWRLIYAGIDHDASCEWDVDLWFHEGEPGPQVAALRILLSPHALTPTEESAPCPLLQAVLDSRKGQNELSKDLGERVRQAVEILIRSHNEALDARGREVPNRDLYAAAVRTVMRMVVVFFAESRQLLPVDRSPLYYANYSLTGLRDQLEKEHARSTTRLRLRRSAWPRVLALFRLVQEGCPHPAMPIPQYGGDLFAPGEADHTDGLRRGLHIFENACFDSRFAHVMTDADVRDILEKLSYAIMKVRQGRGFVSTRVPVDFSDLQSEYIGILYEGLLDYELRQAGPDEPIVFLAIGDEPALPLPRLEAMDDKAIKSLIEKFKDKKAAKGGDEADEEDAEPEDALDEDEDATDEEADGELEEVDESIPEDAVPTDDSPAEDAAQVARERAWAWARRAIEVGKLVRKARSKKPEALAEYERQVAAASKRLVRTAILPGQYYLVRWGGTRKGSGTFYTRPQLAVPTVHRTLRPLAYDPPVGPDGKPDEDAPTAQWTPKQPEEILALKVCDPAVGSGSFPVAALRFLTEALYRSLEHHGRLSERSDRTIVALAEGTASEGRLGDELLPCRPDDPDFEPRLMAKLRRHIVERCLYGVDLDPLAIELARISLWIETMDRDLPFSFLDHKFRCGNALVGCWFNQFRHYPVMAWEREGGDSNHAMGVHFKKNERTKAINAFKSKAVRPNLVDFITGQKPVFETAGGKTPEQVHDEAVKMLEAMHGRRVDLEGEQEKADEYRAWRSSESFAQLKGAFDAWCALWFWPVEQLTEAPLPTTFAQVSDEASAIVSRLTETHRFFHWELEFPDVFRSAGSGFDAILGNPPWDISKPSSKEFFSNIDPLYRSYGKQEALGKQKEYFTGEHDVEEDWLDYCAQFKATSNWISFAAHPCGDQVHHNSNDRPKHDFPLVMRVRDAFEQSSRLHARWKQRRQADVTYADPEHPFVHQGAADINLYKCFLELAHALLTTAGDGGRLGFIVPGGLYGLDGTQALRHLFLDKCRWEWIFGFENRQEIFDIDGRSKFNPVIIAKGGTTDAVRASFMHQDMDDWSLGAAEQFAHRYPRERIPQFSPKSYCLLETTSDSDIAIAAKMYSSSALFDDVALGDRRIVFAKGDFDMVKGSEHFVELAEFPEVSADGRRQSADGAIGLPLYEGRMVGAFDTCKKGWVRGRGRGAKWRDIGLSERTIEPQWVLPATLSSLARGLAHPRVAFIRVTANTNERTMFSSILPPYPTGFTACQLQPVSRLRSGTMELAGILNTFVFDFIIRRRVSGLDIAWFNLEECPLPRTNMALSGEFVSTVARLNCLNPATADFLLAARALNPQFDPTKLAYAPHERLRLRCILDAAVAALYGLDLDDLKWILKDCDHPVAEVTNRAFARQLDPKGFWRVDKHRPPELRHTVLTLVAFRDLERHVEAAAGDRDKGIESFLGQNEGEGWMLPETLRLADYGLGHDDRAKEHQPVASALGPRFYDWQLIQDAEESWRECELHARNLLGEEGFARLRTEVEGGNEAAGDGNGTFMPTATGGRQERAGADADRGGLFGTME